MGRLAIIDDDGGGGPTQKTQETANNNDVVKSENATANGTNVVAAADSDKRKNGNSDESGFYEDGDLADDDSVEIIFDKKADNNNHKEEDKKRSVVDKDVANKRVKVDKSSNVVNKNEGKSFSIFAFSIFIYFQKIHKNLFFLLLLWYVCISAKSQPVIQFGPSGGFAGGTVRQTKFGFWLLKEGSFFVAGLPHYI